MLFLIWWPFACSEEEAPKPFPVTSSIFFEGPSVIEVVERDEDLIEVPIKLSVAQENQLTVSYEVIGEEVFNGSDFELMSVNPIVINAGSTSAKVSIKINDNSVVQPEERKIFLRFKSTGDSEVQIKSPKEVVISILEDDCLPSIPNTATWAGPVLVQDESSTTDGTGSVESSGICSGQVSVAARFFGEQNPIIIVLIQLLPGSTGAESGVAAVARFKPFAGSPQFEYEANGSYSQLTKTIILDYMLFDLNNSANNFTGTHVISVN